MAQDQSKLDQLREIMEEFMDIKRRREQEFSPTLLKKSKLKKREREMYRDLYATKFPLPFRVQ